MSFESASAWLAERGFADRIRRFAGSSATVELAAREIGVEPARIAKTMVIEGPEGPLLIVAAGDRRLDGGKFKRTFHAKPHFVAADKCAERVGHAPGGVCPFGAKPGVPVLIDVSLFAGPTVWPACGDGSSGAEFSPAELERLLSLLPEQRVDVCRAPSPAA